MPLQLPPKTYSVLFGALLWSGYLVGSSTRVIAGDAFGLDAYKHGVEAVSGSVKPYRTKFGNAISVYTIENGLTHQNKDSARFLIQGGLHGNEILGSELVAWLAKRFAKGESLLNGLNGGRVAIDFLPYSNPDGTILYTRYNSNHINLNRNFGVLWGVTKENPGTSAFSEIETKAIRDLMKARQYTGAVDAHGYINWIVMPSSASQLGKHLNASQDQLKKYERWSSVLKETTRTTLPGYEVKTAGELGDGGAFEDYAWWGAGIPAFCLEVFSRDRFVAKTIALKIMDLMTPKSFSKGVSPSGQEDMFAVYEKYIHTMFEHALRLNLPEKGPVKQPTQVVLK